MLFDSTQKQIELQLKGTKILLQKVGGLLNSSCECSIKTFEDLGFSNNVKRMYGGFYTGMYVRWDCDKYFIPVDATINSCGVGIYQINKPFCSFDEFKSSIEKAKKMLIADGIKWNLGSGNHFISLCKCLKTGNQFLILHASNNDYKFGENGLYPDKSVWYYNEIKTLESNNRIMRYIYGSTAEKFYSLYLESQEKSPIRLKMIADYIVNGNLEERLYTQHYGMPTKNSVAIGCQWNNRENIILSSLGENIYIVENKNPNDVFFPHGFGVKLKKECTSIQYEKGKLLVNNVDIIKSESFLQNNNVINRFSDQQIDKNFILKFLSNRNISVIDEYKQLYSYSRDGFKNFNL